ncbi:MAG: hypothetical protein IPM55_24080 [Acidobacteria bacterium]|nr:hypothetical protein [Acidobacteriota bacterium]
MAQLQAKNAVSQVVRVSVDTHRRADKKPGYHLRPGGDCAGCHSPGGGNEHQKTDVTQQYFLEFLDLSQTREAGEQHIAWDSARPDGLAPPPGFILSPALQALRRICLSNPKICQINLKGLFRVTSIID